MRDKWIPEASSGSGNGVCPLMRTLGRDTWGEEAAGPGIQEPESKPKAAVSRWSDSGQRVALGYYSGQINSPV